MNPTVPERLAGLLTAVATAIVITALAILPFLTPAWVSFEQDRSGAPALTGFSTEDLRTATDAILVDLVIGPPDFDVEVNGTAVLNERERGHMRDVRSVFAGFFVIAAVAAAGLIAAYAGARRLGHPERAWAAIRGGAIGLLVGVVIAGVVALVAFETAFEVFHRLFFPGGSYTFDPGTERLVQLFPFSFWSDSTMAVGGLIVVIAALVVVVAGRRARRARSPLPGTVPAAGVSHSEAAG